MKKIKPFKGVKRVFYKGRMQTCKGILALMIIGGLLLSMMYFCRFAYMEYAVSDAHIVVNYPEIAESGYPDGSRFVFYDFVSDDKLQEALEIMQSRGKYLNYTVSDLKGKFSVYSYLDGSASNAVSSNRSMGNDFSYVANEYDITFVQPHDYKNKNIITRLFSPDYSDEFLNVLIDVNKKYISQNKGGIDGFKTLSAVDNSSDYDYEERLNIYRTKINAIVAYLGSIEKDVPDFVSKKYNLTISDIKGRYRLLITNKLDGIADYIDSSAVSKNTEVASNKIFVNLENNQLKFNKAMDRSIINDYAVSNYDHTFTENLINVVRDEKQGLYQARPKTAFDTVVTQKNDELESVAYYRTEIAILNEDLAKYSLVEHSDEEKQRLSAKAEELFAGLDKEYADLTAISEEVVTEYLNYSNKNYINATVEKDSIFSKRLYVKLLVVFFIGALIVFILSIGASVLRDNRDIRKKKKMLEDIRESKGRSV